MSSSHVRRLDHNVRLFVEFTTSGRDIVSYSVTLVLEEDAGAHTIRVYDSAHDFNEMHRHTRSGGKQAGEAFHAGTLGEGMRAAIASSVDGYKQMIEGWNR